MMNEQSPEQVAQRIERLEKQCRRWRWTGSAAVLALAIALTISAVRRSHAPSEIHARQLWLVDDRGRPMIRMGSTNQRPGEGIIEFLDRNGELRLGVGLVAHDSPLIQLISPDGRNQLTLDAGDDRGTGITFKNLERNSGVMLANSSTGIAGLGFTASGGRIVFDLGMH
jgi:hypothetical protein